MNSKVKVYLDASALNRPFDDQRLPRNRLETEAVIIILDQIERGSVTMIGSSALFYENLKSPLVYRREYVATYLGLASVFVTAEEALRERAREIVQQGIAPLDALHLASAERAAADWFLTCDDRMLRKARRGKLTIGDQGLYAGRVYHGKEPVGWLSAERYTSTTYVNWVGKRWWQS